VTERIMATVGSGITMSPPAGCEYGPRKALPSHKPERLGVRVDLAPRNKEAQIIRTLRDHWGIKEEALNNLRRKPGLRASFQ
jgi:hypothetical protein